MTLLSKEHYELMENFERNFAEMRLNKEPKELWCKGIIYENGETNKLFLAYRLGYELGKSVERLEQQTER